MTAEQHHRVVGGPIISPRHSDRAIHARSLGASRFDVIRLVTPEYHVDMDGSDTLTEDILQDCGYSQIKANVDDVMACYNDIILVHHKVMELWYNAYAHTSGPQVDKILHKSLSVFPKLSSMCVDVLEENIRANPDARIRPLTHASVDWAYQAESVGSNSLVIILIAIRRSPNL